MSRIATVFTALVCLGLGACQEKKDDPGPLISSFVAHATVQVSSPVSGENIDWNRELVLVQDPVVLQKAALTLGVDPTALKERIAVEALVSRKLIRIVASHPEESLAQKFAEAYAAACASERVGIVSEFFDKKLLQLEGQFKDQETDVDRDLMTYEKAKKALQEEPIGDLEDFKEGVLFRKKETD